MGLKNTPDDLNIIGEMKKLYTPKHINLNTHVFLNTYKPKNVKQYI